MKLLLILLSFIFVISCSQSSTDKKYGIETTVVVYDYSSEKYEIKKTRILSLKSPKKLNNEVAHFFYKVGSDNDLNYEKPVRLNLATTSSGLYIPEDIQTLNAVSGYYSYDLLYSFHKKLGILNYSKWPKQVNIEAVDANKIVDNAFHDPQGNSTHYLPFKRGHVPTHLNPGIVAHEENHGLFYKQVISGAVNESVFMCTHIFLDKNTLIGQGCNDLFQRYGLDINTLAANHALLRSLDEGLADFAGYVMTKAPDFLYASLGFEKSYREFHRVVSKSLVKSDFPSNREVSSIIENIIYRSRVATGGKFSSLSLYSRLIDYSYLMAGQISSLFNIMATYIVVPESESHLSKREFMYKMIIKKLPQLKIVVKDKFINSKLNYTDLFDELFDEQYFGNGACSTLLSLMSRVNAPKMCRDYSKGL